MGHFVGLTDLNSVPVKPKPQTNRQTWFGVQMVWHTETAAKLYQEYGLEFKSVVNLYPWLRFFTPNHTLGYGAWGFGWPVAVFATFDIYSILKCMDTIYLYCLVSNH